MAIGDKKSGLEPSSIQAQQYRLQFSNLESRAARTITSGQAAQPISRPAASLFQTAPVPAPISTPPVQAAGNTTQEPTYYSTASSLTGAGYFYTNTGNSHIAGAQDSDFELSGSYAMSFAVKFDNLTATHRQYILHTYTGSFASHSLEIYVQNGELNVLYGNKGGYVRYYAPLGNSLLPVNNQGNDYTVITINKKAGRVSSAPADYTSYEVSVGNKITGLARGGSGPAIDSTYDIRSNDHFNIGGTDLAPNMNFSGSLQYFQMYGRTLYTSAQVSGIVNGTSPARDLPAQVRTWSFKGNGVEVNTGTQADDPTGLYYLSLTGSGHQTVTGYY